MGKKKPLKKFKGWSAMDNPVLLDESPEYEIITGVFVARTLTISCNLQNKPAAPPQWKLGITQFSFQSIGLCVY